MSRKQEKKFIILDDEHQTLASATLVSLQGQRKVFELTSQPALDLSTLPAINILSINSPDFMAWRGKVERQRGAQLYFLAEEQIDSHLRRHLRIPMVFRAFLYPATGELRRVPVVSKDISCGGIALRSPYPLRIGKTYELALPCTEPPILVPITALRQINSSGGDLFACQFDDLLPAEEAMIQECIFEYDLQHHR